MKKRLIFFFSILLLFTGVFGVERVEAEYQYAIQCPEDGEKYVVMVWTPSTETETTGELSFNPINGQEFCAPETSSIQDLVKQKLLPSIYAVTDIKRIEILECTPADSGGADGYDWDNMSNSAYKYSEKVVWKGKLTYPKCGTTRRIRYKVDGKGFKGQFFYYIGPYDKKIAQKGAKDNPEALKAYCLNLGNNCDQDKVNCYYYQGCKPKAIGEADKAEAVKNFGNNSENVVCSSILEKIENQCANDPDLCRSNCQAFSKCAYFNSSCVDKTSLTPEQLRALTIAAADEYLKDKYPVPEGYLSKILPPCAFHGTCRSVQDLVILGINIAQFLFSVIGTIAFAMFVYGGFRMMLSMGKTEGVTAGKDAMKNAVIGIVVSFSAYLIVSFILKALQVGPEFKAIGMIIKTITFYV